MESYTDFLNRINAFEKEEIYLGDNYFTVNPSLLAKVTKEGRFKDFYGDTVVFNLDSETKNKLSEITQLLHRNAPECFSEPLISDTFHLTLHDLSNSTELGCIAQDVFFNGLKAAQLFKKIKNQKIHMKTKYIFNMVNTSTVLGLYPSDEKEYAKLMGLYCIFDNIKLLPYPFTPHITLAYFNPNGFDKSSILKLKNTVYILNKYNFEIELDTQQLYYQKFTNMNRYINITSLYNCP